MASAQLDNIFAQTLLGDYDDEAPWQAKIGEAMIPDLKAHQYSQALLRCTKTLASMVADKRHIKLRGLAGDKP
jgi:hypothetical protein